MSKYGSWVETKQADAASRRDPPKKGGVGGFLRKLAEKWRGDPDDPDDEGVKSKVTERIAGAGMESIKIRQLREKMAHATLGRQIGIYSGKDIRVPQLSGKNVIFEDRDTINRRKLSDIVMAKMKRK